MLKIVHVMGHHLSLDFVKCFHELKLGCVCVCVIIILSRTAQLSPVILVFRCYTYGPALWGIRADCIKLHLTAHPDPKPLPSSSLPLIYCL